LPFFVDALLSLELLTGLGGVGATDDEDVGDDDDDDDFLPNGLEKPNLEDGAADDDDDDDDDDDADAVLAGLPPPLVLLGLLPSIAWTAPPSSSTSYTKLNSFIVGARVGGVCLFVLLYPLGLLPRLDGWRFSRWGYCFLMHAATTFFHVRLEQSRAVNES